jgi:hypothetical protein
MRRAGNLMVQIGIESSTDEELRDFRKRLTTDQVKEAVDLLKRNDIVSQGLIIVGTPKETARSGPHQGHQSRPVWGRAWPGCGPRCIWRRGPRCSRK